MSIKLISVKCPDCGARLDIEEGRKMAFCSYCGAKILIKDENEYTFRHIDETGIKKAEIDSKIRMRQLEIEASNSRQSNKIRQLLTYIWIGSLFVIGAMVIIVWLTSDLGWISAFNTFFYIGGPIVGGGAYLLFKVIPEKENEKYILADGGRRLPKYQGGYMGQNYEMIRKMFISKGFTNVTCVNMHDVTLNNTLKICRKRFTPVFIDNTPLSLLIALVIIKKCTWYYMYYTPSIYFLTHRTRNIFFDKCELSNGLIKYSEIYTSK